MLLGPKILLVSHVCLGFRTSRCFGAINIPESFICVAVLLSPFLLSIPVAVLLPGCFWAQDTLRLFVSHLFPCSFPLLSQTCFRTSLSIAILFSGYVWDTKFSLFSTCFCACLPCWSIAQCSLFWLLWGKDSRCVPSVSAPVSLLVLNLFWLFFLRCCCSPWVLPAHRMLIGCSLSNCLFPYLSSLLSPFRALLSFLLSFFLSFFSFFLCFFLSLSLSLALLLSRCLLGPLILLVCHLFPYVSSLFSPSCILVSLVLSKLYPSFAPHCYSSLRLLWAECFSLLVFLRISLLACLCVLWDKIYYPLHSLTLSLLHVSLQAVSLSSLHYRASS